jgi:hypothetical protein
MRLRFMGIALLAGSILATVTLRANLAEEPGDCPNDSKLLNDGPTSVFGDGPGTWWGLIIDAVQAAGFDEVDDQIAYLNEVFGTTFDSLEALKDFNLQLVSDVFDKNQNGYVCAFDLRGTRAYLDPLSRLSYFGIGDDHLRKH